MPVQLRVTACEILENGMRSETIASVGLIIGGVLWGLFWIPVRAIGEFGLPGAWAGAVIYAGTAVVLIPLAIFRRNVILARWRELVLCGLFTGTAFSLYSTSLLLTDVVRVLLLFYLTPVWGTLLGIAVLGERLTLNRTIALALGLTGLLVVLGIGEEWPWPRNLGDWLALCSGIAWAYGSLKLYQIGAVAVPEQILAFVFGSLVVTLVTLVVGGSEFGGNIDPSHVSGTLPWGLLLALYVLPMLFLTIWPAMLLTPGRVGLLLMSDVVVGVSSAAALTGEVFGWRELGGSAMIVGAAVVEVVGRRTIWED